MNGSQSWIEPPPHRRGFGSLAKGCLFLVVFCILLALSFVAGTFYAAKFLRNEYFSEYHERLPASEATPQEEQEVRARWDSFEKAARAHEYARIELSGDDLNALIAYEPKLRGHAYVTINDNAARLQVSFAVPKSRWMRGRYVNAQCSVQSGPTAKPEEAHITSIVVNGKPVGEDFLNWQYGSWSFKRYMADWMTDTNLKRLEISDGKVILETNAEKSGTVSNSTNDDPFASVSPSPTPAARPSPE
ncbi:MAG TPA: hypothetical protein VH170_06680 [Chthoniobacterales bacterium]|jgi:hypothetical protein|nr:hypothetical protein [Chthoniobacterales bacterium]